jgi:UDP-N-acetyl-D-glucosamine dehydrogenase
MDLQNKILKRTAKVGIIGMGYVGLPLGVEIAQVGYPVFGVDTDKNKVRLINSGKSFIEDVTSEELLPLVRAKKIIACEDYKVCKNCDIINICVPTPFTKSKDPDVSYIVNAGEAIAKYLKAGQLIILRSTSYPETTEKVLQPILEKTGLKAGKDFYLSFAPERIDPGNRTYNTKTTPVVVGGITKTCTKLTELFYAQFVDKVVPVSNPRVAEMSKLLENIFRSVNIALVNELALMCERMGNIDVWEVIDAAKSKPFGYMPFYPGPGIGGHCILIDPYYLAWKAREYDFHSNFIELAAQVNENMPFKVVDRLFEIFGENCVCSKTASIFIIGAAFKKNVGDTRHSPAIKVMDLLAGKVKKISYNDPFVPMLKINQKTYRSVPLTADVLKKADCVLILTNHDLYDAKFISKHSRLILDARNLIKTRGSKKVYTIGLK